MTDTEPGFLKLQNIEKSYGETRVIKGLSANINKGELVTFIGPSGCGKSTLLRCIAGFTPINNGNIVLDGKVINTLLPDKRKTGMVFQNYALFPHLTVEENIGYGLKILKLPKTEIKNRVEELLDLVHLPDFGIRRIAELSGGQQQRVALARALSLNPKILLLDEPLSNLDANLRIAMRAEIKRIQKRLNLTVIFVTHDQEEAMSISDRVLVMSSGTVEQLGTPLDIYDRPATEFIAGFVGYVNNISGQVTSVDLTNRLATMTTDIGEIHVQSDNQKIKTGENRKLIIRPEAIAIVELDKEGRDNVFPGEITNFMYTGSLVKYTIAIKNCDLIVEVQNPRKTGILSLGQRTAIQIPEDIHMI